MSEAPIVKRVMMKASQIGSRLFRNNRGQFYTMDKKRIVRAGLEAPGASDLIGITPVVITKEMVGITLGVFTAPEVKDHDWKHPANDHERIQENFHTQINKLGGFAFFIKDAEDLPEKIADCMAEKIFKKAFDNGEIRD